MFILPLYFYSSPFSPLNNIYKNYYYNYYYFFFSHQLTLMVFQWNLSDSKSPQVSRTLLSILSVLNNAVVWMVSTRPPTSKSSSPFSNPLAYNTKSTNYIWYNCHLHVPQFFQFPRKVEVFILLFTFFQFYSVVIQYNKVLNFANCLFFLLIIISSGLLAEIRLSNHMSKSHWSLCMLFSRTGFWVVHIRFVRMVKLLLLLLLVLLSS